eukprot:scaffold32648_cov166-Skeletonema_menzelii.AAC.3
MRASSRLQIVGCDTIIQYGTCTYVGMILACPKEAKFITVQPAQNLSTQTIKVSTYADPAKGADGRRRLR